MILSTFQLVNRFFNLELLDNVNFYFILLILIMFNVNFWTILFS